MTAPTLLDVADLACGHDRRRAVLAGVDLRVRRGETVALVGPSGCGKTTLLATVLGLLAPLGGRVTVCDATLPARPAPGRVGYIPQGLGLVRHASVLHNVLAGALPETGPVRTLLRAFRAEHVDRAHAALAQVGLADAGAARPTELSGGQRRRVAIARALLQRPALLLADEIVSELDDATADAVLDAVAGLQRETGMGVLIVEHDIDRSCAVADVVCCVGDGGLRATLAPTDDRARQVREVMAAATPALS